MSSYLTSAENNIGSAPTTTPTTKPTTVQFYSPNSLQKNNSSSSNSSNTTGLLMETSHNNQQQTSVAKFPYSQDVDDSRLSVNIQDMPNRSEFGISAITEPILHSNPPSFLSHNCCSLSNDIFPNPINNNNTTIPAVVEKKSTTTTTTAKIASDLIELQKNNRLQVQIQIFFKKIFFSV